MSSPNFRSIRFLISTVFLLLASLPALADSQVRIVRLSYIEGGVKIDRGTGQFETAMVNLPISQGARLRTSGDGRAEVEFEDGSTLRLTPETAIEFPQLSLRDSGGKASTVEVKKGSVYLDYAASKNEEFAVQFARETVRLSHAAHLRIGIADEDAAVAVFKGDTQIEGLRAGSTRRTKPEILISRTTTATPWPRTLTRNRLIAGTNNRATFTCATPATLLTVTRLMPTGPAILAITVISLTRPATE
jgi:hypothetical protein